MISRRLVSKTRAAASHLHRRKDTTMISRKLFSAGLLAAAAAAALTFGTGSAEARKYPTPGCHPSMPPGLCDIIKKRDKKGPPKPAQQASAGQSIAIGGAHRAVPCSSYINGCYKPPIRKK
jgi:hypothetical protein